MPVEIAVPMLLRKRVEEWRSRLIDLSKRNQLLNFRKNKSSTLEFREQDLDLLYGRLANENSYWKVFVPEEGKKEQLDLLAEVDEFIQPNDDELVSGETDQKTLKRILTNLFRKSREEYQERGVHVLHIGLGMLTWSDLSSSSKADSFLLLCPVMLNREIDNPVSAYLDAIQEWLPQEQWKLERFAVLGMFFF